QPPAVIAEVPPPAKEAPVVTEDDVRSGEAEVDSPSDETTGSKVFINIGRKDGYNAQRLKDIVADLGGLLPEDIHSASIRPRFSFLTLDEEYVEDLLEAINGEKVKGRTLRIERARDE
ncbi:MAG: DbpA RNA binding domain-containing protein, partial [Bradymonadia bacterium]